MGKLLNHKLDRERRLRGGLLRRVEREPAKGTPREVRNKEDFEIKDPG